MECVTWLSLCSGTLHSCVMAPQKLIPHLGRLVIMKALAHFLAMLCLCCGFGNQSTFAQSNQVIDLGGRRELFVNDYLVGEMKNVELMVHQPTREEIAVKCDKPWEGNGCGYFTVLQDRREAVYRMYYHAWQIPTGIEPGAH
jgi:hypothetical protein